MTPTDQSKPTNCFAACLATLLNIQIEDVPASADGASWDLDVTQQWLGIKYHKQLLELSLGENGSTIHPLVFPVLCILTGPSPRVCASGMHAVVARTNGLDGFEILHDPHLTRDGLAGEPRMFCFLVDVYWPQPTHVELRESLLNTDAVKRMDLT